MNNIVMSPFLPIIYEDNLHTLYGDTLYNLDLTNLDINYILYAGIPIQYDSQYPLEWGPNDTSQRLSEEVYPIDWADRIKESIKLGNLQAALWQAEQGIDLATRNRDLYPNTYSAPEYKGWDICIGRILMERSIVYRLIGEYSEADKDIEEATKVAIASKNLPLFVEITRHLVNLDIDSGNDCENMQHRFAHAVANAVASLILAAELKRKDSEWFSKGLIKAVKAEPKIQNKHRKICKLFFKSPYFRKGMLQQASLK